MPILETRQSQSNDLPRIELALLVLFVSAYFVWFAWPLVAVVSENIRMVSAFVVDEGIYARWVASLIEQHTLYLGRQDQGHLYIYLVAIPLLVLSYLAPVSEQTIIVTLRLVCVIFGIGTVVTTFILARRYFGRTTAWLSALFLCLTPAFTRSATTIHSDSPQLFFLVLCIYFYCRLVEEGALRNLMAASVAAGFAFACKYVGGLMMPLIWMALIFQNVASRQEAREKNRHVPHARTLEWSAIIAAGALSIAVGLLVPLNRIKPYISASYGNVSVELGTYLEYSATPFALLLGGFLTGLAVAELLFRVRVLSSSTVSVIAGLVVSTVVFGLAVVASSPLSLGNLIKGLVFQFTHISFGHTFAGSDDRFLWFKMMLTPDLLGVGLSVLAVIALGHGLYQLGRGGLKKLATPRVMIWLWVLLYVAFVVLQVKKQSVHYLLPVVPPLLILSVQPIQLLLRCIRDRFARNPAPASVIVVVAVLAVLGLSQPYTSVFVDRQNRLDQAANSPRLKAGVWLAENYPFSARIFSDVYVYVPPDFRDVEMKWGPSLWCISERDPDVVIINTTYASRFSNPEMAGSYAGGEHAFKDIYNYYKTFEQDRMAGYQLAQDLGEIRVYARQVPKIQPIPAPNELETNEKHKIQPLGYVLHSDLVETDNILKIELFWRLEQVLPPDTYGVFFHLRDSANTTIAQADWHFLAGRRFPTITQHFIKLPHEVQLNNNDYEFKVGVYRVDTQERARVMGDVSGENAIILKLAEPLPVKADTS